MLNSRHAQFNAPGPAIERRVERVLDKMTVQEKIGAVNVQQLSGDGIPKGGVPPLVFGGGPLGAPRSITFEDRKVGATAFPATIGLAATWNEELAYRYGAGVGRDARARGVHVILGPGVNIYRSPLCSRNFEYCGEDPYLAGKTAAAWVRGCQDQAVGVTVKHFAVNFQEYDRYFVSSDVSERALQEIYLEAFRLAVQEGGASGVMTAYNKVNGDYCSQNRHLITEVLKEDWGFDGFVISDAVSTHDATTAVNAGLDLELPVPEVLNERNLLPALLDGRIVERQLDEQVRRILRVAYCFGWADHEQRETTIPLKDEANATVAQEVAAESVVLLRNESDLLPFHASTTRTIAVVGPTAHPAVTGGGGSSYVLPWRAISILDGIRAAAEAAGVRIVYAKGCDPFRHLEVQTQSRYETPDGHEGVVAEYWNDRDFKGEPACRIVEPNLNLFWMRDPPAPGVSKDSFAARWTGMIRPELSGNHVCTIWGGDGEFRVRVGDTWVFDTWGHGHTGAIQNSIELEAGMAYELVAEYRPTWRYNWIRFGWEHEQNMWPDHDRAIEIAREADAVVFCGGHTRWTESENFDREFAMPEIARRFLDEVLEVNPRTAVILTGGGNIEMASWVERSAALLHAWYPGQEGGHAIGRILFGETSPSGKLPITLERSLSDRSSSGSYHDIDGDKRVFLNDGIFSGYRYTDEYGPEPLYPFGFGLSYTAFAYADLKLSASSIEAGDSVTASFTIRNSGHTAGAECAQLYVADLRSSVPRPPKELKGYTKVFLQPGGTKQVEIQLNDQALRFFDPVRERWIVELGQFEILIGASSRDIRLRTTLDIVASA